MAPAVTDPAPRLTEALAVGDEVVPRLRARLAEVTQAESERAPDSAAWSVREIAHHLVLVIRRAAAYCPEIVAADPPDRFDYAAVVARRRFTLPDVADVARSGKGVAPEAVRPAAGGDIRGLTDDLAAAWEELKTALHPLRHHDLSRYYYEHYRLGPFTLYEYLEFQGYHALKHLRQIERTLAQVRAPASGGPMSQDAVAKNRERFDQALAFMDEARDKVLALLGGVSQAQADRRPAENEWSVGEVAHHLAITERAVMEQVVHLAAHAPANEFDYAEAVKARPFRLEDAGDVRITGKAQHPPELTPTPNRALADLVRELRDARTHTRQVLAPLRDQDLSVKFYRHRRFGPMTLYERLRFTAYHDLKHLGQMERALARIAA
jgi:uncharacterized damage-inducible protein DinB